MGFSMAYFNGVDEVGNFGNMQCHIGRLHVRFENWTVMECPGYLRNGFPHFLQG